MMKDIKRVAKTFDKIAEHFDKTRNEPWSEVIEFLEDCFGSVLDLGCGNGRHIMVGDELGLNMKGLDASINLLKIAKTKTNDDLLRGNVKKLPFTDNSFDNIIYIATIHHLKRGRVDSLKEAKRVLKKNGRIMISSWTREQDRWDLKPEEKEVMVPWHREDGVIIERYYYLYKLKELVSDVKESGLDITESFLSKGNNYVIASKK